MGAGIEHSIGHPTGSSSDSLKDLTRKLQTEGNLVGLETRRARALIGWMAETDAQILIGIPQKPMTPRPEDVCRVRDAQATVRSRPTGVDQTHVLSDIGEELRDYAAEFQAQPSCQPYILGGWTIRVVNLNEICALQPIVHLDYMAHSGHCNDLLQQASQKDMPNIAKLTLPIPDPAVLPGAQFDAQRNAWILNSSTPDTRIVGHFNTRVEVRPGVFGMAYGFCVVVLPSFVQVVLYRGRYFLKDGYHRSLALLEKGITHIPALFRQIPEPEPLKVEGRFADETILGPHPPLFSDYLRDDVAAVVFHLACRKTITIQSTENRKWG